MSRSGYIDDGGIDHWAIIRWRGQVASSIRGKRGQKLLVDMAEALDAMPDKRLIPHELECADGVCALGALGKARGMDMAALDPNDTESVAFQFDIARQLACEIVYMNDEYGPYSEVPEGRWKRMRAWVSGQIKGVQ